MTCVRYRDWLLLRDSGELSRRRWASLQAHLAECAECRIYAAQVAATMADARQARASYPMDPVTLAVLKDVAGHQRRRPVFQRVGWDRLAWAAAAAAVVAAFMGIALVLGPRSDRGDSPAPQLALTDQNGMTEVLAWNEPMDVTLDLLAEEIKAAREDFQTSTLAESSTSDDEDQIAKEILYQWEA